MDTTKLLLFLLLPTAGCSLITQPDLSRLGPRDRDAGAADAGPLADGGTPTDGGLPAGDADPPDANLPDADLPDAGSPPGRDAGRPTGPACTDRSDDQPYPGHPDMVGCDGALSQCEAAVLCAPGWHLCTYTEYAARAGGPAGTIRWLASCVRSSCSDTPTPPTDGLCGDCASGEAMSPIPLSFECAMPARSRSQITCDVGVAADTDPIGHRVGTPTQACLAAQAFPTRTPLGAQCCW